MRGKNEELIYRWQCTQNTNDLEKILAANSGLVWTLAVKYWYPSYTLEVEDLLQAGLLGLIDAARLFDTSRGTAFSTYATPTVCRAIIRCIDNDARDIRIPSHSLRKHGKIQKQYTKECAIQQSKVPLEDFAMKNAYKLEDVEEALSPPRSAASLDEPLDDGEISDGRYFLGSECGRLREVENKITIEQLMSRLDDREKEVVRLRYWEDMKLDDIGRRLNINRNKAANIERVAIQKMRRLAEEGTIQRGWQPQRDSSPIAYQTR